MIISHEKVEKFNNALIGIMNDINDPRITFDKLIVAGPMLNPAKIIALGKNNKGLSLQILFHEFDSKSINEIKIIIGEMIAIMDSVN